MLTQTHSLKLRGLNTTWLEAGDRGKPILLLLHGYPDSPQTWEFQFEYFRPTFNIVAPYSRGAGPSEQSSSVGRYGTESSCLDLLQVLSEIDPSGRLPIVCVGHDLGAVHAWSLAPLLGSRLRALVVLNGLSLPVMAARWRSLSQHLRSWYIYAMQLPLLPEAVTRLFPGHLLAFAYERGRLPLALRPSSIEARGASSAPLNQYRAFARSFLKARFRRLPRLRAPLLVIWGNKDPFLETPQTAEWERVAADITSRILPAGHWVHRQCSSEVNRLVEKFLKQKKVL